MAVGVKISQLPVATSTDGTELAVIVQQGETRQVTIDQFVAPVATSINAEVSLKAYRTGDYLDATQYIEFDTSTIIPASVGRLSWNPDDGTLNLGLIGGNVVNQIGQELVQRCYNNTGAEIPEGAVVQIVGATGQRLTVELAVANTDSTTATVIGVATEAIPDKTLGYVATEGFVRQINTIGFSDGDVLWLSPTVPGQLVNVRPVAPNQAVMIGYVVKGGSGGAGSIFVKVQNGYKLGDLHNVKVSASASLANNEVLVYNTSAGVWTNSTLFVDIQSSVSVLTTRVEQVSAAISVNNAAVSTLDIRVSAVSALAANSVAAITSVNNTVSALEIRVSAVSARASANAAAITSTNNVVSALEIRVSSVSAAAVSINNVVSALEVRVSGVSTANVSNAAAISALYNFVSAMGVRLNAVSTQSSSLVTSLTSTNNVVSALELRVSAVSAAAVSINNVVSALEIRVSSVSARTSVNAAAIVSTNNVVSTLEIRVSNISTAVSVLQQQVLTLNLSAVNARLDTVSAATSVNAAAITSINNVVSALEIRVSAVSAAAAATSAAVVSVNNVVSVLEVRVSGVSAHTSVNAAAITSINNVVSALEIRVSSVSAAVVVASAAITSVNAVVSLKVNRSGDTMTGNLTVPSINSGPLAGFRNAIINGNFDIWQRGTIFSNPAAFSFAADRWRIRYDGSGATRTISRQAFTLGQTDVPGEPAYFFRYAQSVAGSGATYTGFNQNIESVRTFAGQQVTVSFWAKAATSITLPVVAFEQYFGTGGSPSATVLATAAANVSIGTTWAKYTYTVSLPSIAGKTIGSDGNDALGLFWDLPTNTTFTFDLAQVQLEAGPVATPFERRPIGTELALCQRYYEKSFPLNTAPANALGASESGAFILSGPADGGGFIPNMYFHIPFAVRKRAAPTFTAYNYTANVANTFRVFAGTTGYNITPNIDSLSETNVGGYVQQAGATLAFAAWTASAEL